jgi:uncharacterized protein (TIGR00369 family)
MKKSDDLGGVDPGRGDWGEPREKTVTWHDPMITASAVSLSSGLEFLRAILGGALPPPPIAQLLAFTMKEVEPGRVLFECIPDESAYNPIGVVHGGLVCTLADTVTACAVQTTLPAGVTYTSIDLSVSYLRPVTKDTGLLRATGTVTKPGRRVAFASAEIASTDGKLLATATSTCLVIGDGSS